MFCSFSLHSLCSISLELMETIQCREINTHSWANSPKSNLVYKVDNTQLVPLLNPPLGAAAASEPFSLHTSTICSQPEPDLGMDKVHGGKKKKKQIQDQEPENPISSLNFACERSFGFRLSKQWASSLTMRDACSKDYFRSGRLKVIATFHRDVCLSYVNTYKYQRSERKARRISKIRCSELSAVYKLKKKKKRPQRGLCLEPFA